jgi:hypothetical protein
MPMSLVDLLTSTLSSAAGLKRDQSAVSVALLDGLLGAVHERPTWVGTQALLHPLIACIRRVT